ncbi:MAG: tRNA (adenosine(37)-N6)-threonylcarbamoyltransferase complex ATPase subunit type 1 TsaE [Clostridia bacterium]|nr:tRNA (adenosine(37)-N6)-threonylcarbamoyltransferase complex ATPase subunit type 1 TsaE [Clostridia bacterium]
MTLPDIRASLSADTNEAVGEELARNILTDASLPRFVALFGDLGVGKTAFVRGFTRVIAPTARVKSPTFALVNEYKGTPCSVFHFDMYRIEDEDELYSIGFYDYADRNGICLTEWSENIEYALPEAYIRVEIIKDNALNTDSRRIEIVGVGI